MNQKRFRKLQLALMSLAVLTALFAILKSADAVPAQFRVFVHQWYVPSGTLHVLVILMPVILSIVAAYNSHFREGSKWILLRGAAEALKREIFRYRTQTGAYSDEQCVQTSRELKLAARVKDITASLEESDVNKTNLESVPAGDQGRQTLLAPDQYIQARIHNQRDYLRRTQADLREGSSGCRS